MPRRGPKPSHLKLVEVAEAVPDSDRCGRVTTSGSTCARTAGWGTDHAGEGACRDHEAAVESEWCPFPLTDVQKTVWNALAGHMKQLGLMKPMFWPTVYGLVAATAQLYEAQAAVGSVTVKGDRSEKKHPAATVMNQMLSQVRTYSAELGLTPSSLAKIGLEKKEDESVMGRLIRGS